MKKVLFIFGLLIVSFLFWSSFYYQKSFAFGPWKNDDAVFTTGHEKIISSDVIWDINNLQNQNGDNNIIRKGIKDGLGNKDTYGNDNRIWWVISPDDNSELKTHEQSRDAVINKISIVINYSLALLGMVSLIFLLYHGFLVVVKWDIEEGKKWIKTSCIALVWIGLSWFIVSFILRLIDNLAPKD